LLESHLQEINYFMVLYEEDYFGHKDGSTCWENSQSMDW